MSLPRTIALLTAALAAVVGLGYVASQTVAAPPGVDLAAQRYVPAPVPAEVEREVPRQAATSHGERGRNR